MIEKLIKKPSKFILFSYVLVLLGLMSSLFIYWQRGMMGDSFGGGIYHAINTASFLKKESPIETIKNDLNEGDSKRAIKNFETFKEKIAIIDVQIPSEEYSVLEKQTIGFKNSLNKLLSFPKLEDVLRISIKKISSFNQFVKGQNYRRLTRMSSQLETMYTKPIMQANSLIRLANEAKDQVEQMKEVTQRSVLSRSEKNEIINQLEQLSPEIGMLADFSSQTRKVLKQLNGLEKNFAKWFEEIRPQLAAGEIKQREANQKFFIFQLALLVVAFVLLFIGWILSRRITANAQRHIEGAFADILERIATQKNIVDYEDFSPAFFHALESKADFIAKRMNHGNLFQNTLPFPAICLDHNLKLYWRNNYFCEMWQIDTHSDSSSISWDYLRKMTNLDSEDPVLDALRSSQGGIFQVRVRAQSATKSIPYEMYVTPLENQGKRYVMLYFYQLTHMEDRITAQSKSLVDVVSHAIEKLNLSFNERPNMNELKSSFAMANAQDFYEEFNELAQKIHETIGKFRNEVSSVHDSEKNLEQSLLNKTQVLTQTYEEIKNTRPYFNRVKESLIKLSDELKRSQTNYDELSSEYEQLRDAYFDLKKTSDDWRRTLIKVKADLKLLEQSRENRQKVDIIYSKCSQMINGMDFEEMSFDISTEVIVPTKPSQEGSHAEEEIVESLYTIYSGIDKGNNLIEKELFSKN